MILAAAQINPRSLDIAANLEEHYRLINQAADHSADLIIFPEMSISGYEREHAQKLAVSPEDPRLQGLKSNAS